MRLFELFVLGFMLCAVPISVLGTPMDDAYVAAQEGGDMDEQTHP